METALVIMGAVSLFITLLAALVAVGLMVWLHRDMREALTLIKVQHGHIATTERTVVSIHSFLAADMTGQQQPMGMPAPPPPPGAEGKHIFKTEDGQHEASSFEELMHKIANDPRYRVANPEDIEKLRNLFEDYTRRMGEDEEVEGDEWKNPEDEEDGTE